MEDYNFTQGDIVRVKPGLASSGKTGKVVRVIPETLVTVLFTDFTTDYNPSWLERVETEPAKALEWRNGWKGLNDAEAEQYGPRYAELKIENIIIELLATSAGNLPEWIGGAVVRIAKYSENIHGVGERFASPEEAQAWSLHTARELLQKALNLIESAIIQQ